MKNIRIIKNICENGKETRNKDRVLSGNSRLLQQETPTRKLQAENLKATYDVTPGLQTLGNLKTAVTCDAGYEMNRTESVNKIALAKKLFAFSVKMHFRTFKTFDGFAF